MILAHFGVRTCREKGRIPCPLHGGSNRQAFSYEREKWFSFCCGVGGDIFSLAMALGRVGFPEALELCASVGGIRLTHLDPAVARRAIAERRTVVEAHRNAEHAWWARWSALIRQLDFARDDAFVAECALRHDPDRRLQLTRDIERTFGSAIRLRDELEQQVEDFERGWRAWAAKETTSRRSQAAEVA